MNDDGDAHTRDPGEVKIVPPMSRVGCDILPVANLAVLSILDRDGAQESVLDLGDFSVLLGRVLDPILITRLHHVVKFVQLLDGECVLGGIAV